MTHTILGIDAGSVSVSAVVLTEEKEIIFTESQFHHGEIIETLKRILADVDLATINHVAVTSSSPETIVHDEAFDNQVAVIKAAKFLHKNVSAILIVGGEKFGLIAFDDEGNYQSFIKNTSCAAGTGSFLDQQAKRLNLESAEELSSVAFNNKKPFPKIASRCAVFAKTDLIHAQQEGYTFEEISDGLCHGLAKNIVDTLFSKAHIEKDLIFCGGVSKNKTVLKHIADLIGVTPVTDDYSHLYGALGAAIGLCDNIASEPLKYDSKIYEMEETPLTIQMLIKKKKVKKDFYYRPLKLRKSIYPDFTCLESYHFHSPDKSFGMDKSYVETDIYEPVNSNEHYDLVLGIDVGSTSTKAVVTDVKGMVIAGFYTRTAGRPLDAVKLIFETIDDMFRKKQASFTITSCGTTGSGRKFIGQIVGAGMIVDEITAHARAAYEINPATDTIIEIGGQDAKFTTLKNGMVTSSIMNNVCAAGTGSFIEEQARKLHCTIYDYSDRAEKVLAPLASDRCTVFMERDLNHLLSDNYSVNEILASVLHSVRENYLLKVASESNIGDTILFQGATAKNKALVAAFEQRLGKPIHVSKFCHLTGAIGTALILIDDKIKGDEFRGIELYKKDIQISSNVCDICANHCKITVADIDDSKVAYGFLCGRDYDTNSFVNNNKSGFDLFKSRRKAFKIPSFANSEGGLRQKSFTIGIPAALHLHEDLSFWKHFFSQLDIKVITSENFESAVKIGKNLTGAEFCAPVAAVHGHVDYLLKKADYIFMPFYFENKNREKNIRRQYCYYTQFVPALIKNLDDNNKDRILSPVVKHLYTDFNTKIVLYRLLNTLGPDAFNFLDVSSAFDDATKFKKTGTEMLQSILLEEIEKTDDIKVVFLGRPYTVLNKHMNSGIPDIFASIGIKSFYQDMITTSEDTKKPIDPLLNQLHWEYAAKIMETAETISSMDGVYPVFITSFKCSPDSFIIEYFKKLMEAHKKPYLVLELDEHDSSVGYETRIESAVRAFRNHSPKSPIANDKDNTFENPFETTEKTLISQQNKTVNYDNVNLQIVNNLDGKTIVLPNWDSITCRFLTDNLINEGYKAVLIDETELTIRESLKFNSGECIPINAIAQGYIECMKKYNLDPEKTVLWNLKSEISCNIKMYPYHIKYLLNSYGGKYKNAGVYKGDISFKELSFSAAINAYLAFMIGGLIRRIGCRIRPYEVIAGETDRVIAKSVKILSDAFQGRRSKLDAVNDVVSRMEWIETHEVNRRPKVAVFGDLYSRDNDIITQDLIRYIETHGGEVITTPYSYYAKMIANTYFKKWFVEGNYKDIISFKALQTAMNRLERKYFDIFNRILKETEEKYDVPPEKILSKYGIVIENTGESMDNILKVFYIKEHHPDISLFVQASPAFCCASLLTEAMSKNIEKNTGVPVVPVTYDGTGGDKNESIIPYLKFPIKRKRSKTIMDELQSLYE